MFANMFLAAGGIEGPKKRWKYLNLEQDRRIRDKDVCLGGDGYKTGRICVIQIEPSLSWTKKKRKTNSRTKTGKILQKSDKSQFFTNQLIPALGSGYCSVGWLVVNMLKKPQNCPISDFFNLTPKYFLPLLPYNDLVPPSTDPEPPSTNQYRPILTQHHQVPTSNALY